MKKAFTMIELIFVIVIIGILAAVAIPKLAATRDDAKISTEMANLSQVIFNLGAEFAAQGAFNNYTVADADEATFCFDVTALGSDGVTIAPITQSTSNCSSLVLEEASSLAASGGLLASNESAKTYTFGGMTIVK